jgi:hypothetical protein
MGSEGVQAPLRRKAIVIPAAFVGLAITAHVAWATQPGYEISVGVIETDNVQRVPQGGSNDTILEQQLNFTWHERRPLYDADIDAALSHLSYVPRTFGDEVVGNFIGDGRVNLVPEVLTWDLSDNFGQGTVDPFQALTPANREIINYVSTGPQAMLPLGGGTFLNASGSYGKVSYQTSPLDSTRYSGTLGALHKLSPNSSIALNVHDEKIDFQNDTVNTDYSSQAAYLRVDTKGARTTLSADVGYGRLQGVRNSPGTLIAHLEITRRVSASSMVAAYVGHEYSDAAESFRQIQTVGGANLNSQPTLQTGTPFTNNYVMLAWNFSRNRTSWGLNVSEYKDVYQQGGGLNDTRTQLDGHLSRLLSPTLELMLTEDFIRDHFENTLGSYSQSTTQLNLTWRVGRRLSLSFAYGYAKRTSDLPITDFTENRLWVMIGYGRPAQVPPGPPAPPTLRGTTY